MNLHEITKKTNDIIKNSENCYVSTINGDGFPHVATRSLCKNSDIKKCYVSTNYSGNLAQTILLNNKMSICIHKNNDNITMMGTGKVITNSSIKEEMWLDWFINHYPKGVNDPEYCIIEYTTRDLSLWIDNEVVKISIDKILKVQSRCGLMCDTCSFKEPCNCRGCIQSMGNPFHGECPIAICCQDKGYEHCGQCDVMPCEKLKQYSCSDGEHSDNPKGSRLDVLRLWL